MQLKSENIFVIVPCYNEEKCIAATLRDLREKHPSIRIVVVNDGSEDATLAQLRSMGDLGLTVLDIPINSGIGTAVQTGLIYAERNGADCAIKFDGDGQHLAEEIPLLLEPLQQGGFDLVIGSRFLKKTAGGFRSSAFRRCGICLFRWLSVLLTGKQITDATSGFRAYSRSALCFAAQHYPSFDYPEPEECILFLRNRFRVCEVPCRMAVRQGGSSSIRPIKAAYYMLKVSFSMIMERFRPMKRKA